MAFPSILEIMVWYIVSRVYVPEGVIIFGLEKKYTQNTILG